MTYRSDQGPGARCGAKNDNGEMHVARWLEGWWIPDARVRHFIPKRRQRVSFLRDFFFGQGLQDGLELPTEKNSEFFGRPRYL
jgi:hypothetical protein